MIFLIFQVHSISCTLCSLNFTNHASMNAHCAEDHPPQTRSFKDGVLQRNANKQFPCGFCAETYKQRKSVYMHEQSTHGRSSAKVIFQPWRCKLCKRTFARKDCLDRHIASKQCVNLSKPLRFPCTVCKKVYKSERSRKAHFLKLHRAKNSVFLHKSKK